jgi:hypothetical protein
VNKKSSLQALNEKLIALHPEWQFMVFLSVVFVFIYAWSIAQSTVLQSPLVLISFSLLFLLHLALHWLCNSWLERGWSLYLYLGIQTFFAFVLVTVAGAFGPLFGLYFAMLGESVGLLRSGWRIAAAVIFYLGLAVINFFSVQQTANFGIFPWYALAILAMAFFVVIYVML